MPTAAALRVTTPGRHADETSASAVWPVDETPGDQQPRRLPWITGGQVKPDSTCGTRDLDADLEEPKAQRIHLHVRKLGAVRSAAQLVHEHVSRAMEQEAKLVGPEAVTAQSVGLQGVLEVFDRVLAGLAARHVEVIIEMLCTTLERRHDEANVGADRLVLRLDQHAI